MLSQHLEQFLQHLKYERNVSPHTLRNYASDLEQFRDHLFRIEKRDDMPVEQIDRLTIREWMSELHAADKKKASSRGSSLACGRSFNSSFARET
jgi:integrase/recombinase XerC